MKRKRKERYKYIFSLCRASLLPWLTNESPTFSFVLLYLLYFVLASNVPMYYTHRSCFWYTDCLLIFSATKPIKCSTPPKGTYFSLRSICTMWCYNNSMKPCNIILMAAWLLLKWLEGQKTKSGGVFQVVGRLGDGVSQGFCLDES